MMNKRKGSRKSRLESLAARKWFAANAFAKGGAVMAVTINDELEKGDHQERRTGTNRLDPRTWLHRLGAGRQWLEPTHCLPGLLEP